MGRNQSGALWPLSLAKALSALMWKTRWPQRKAIFYTVMTLFVMIPQSTYSLTNHLKLFLFFMGILMGKTKETKVIVFLFCFLPNHCDWICEKLHPILYLCNKIKSGPCLALRGSVTDYGGGHHTVKVETVLSITTPGFFSRPINPALSVDDPRAHYWHTLVCFFVQKPSHHSRYCCQFWIIV